MNITISQISSAITDRRYAIRARFIIILVTIVFKSMKHAQQIKNISRVITVV